MAIKVNTQVVIDDARNLTANQITFPNSSVISTAGNPLIELKYSRGQIVQTLNNPNVYSTSASDNFGNSVAISGNYAIVGAYYEDDAGGTNSGKAYIFNVTTGTLVWTLNNPNTYGTSANDNFGRSVAISGNYAIVGAYYEDDAGGTNSGKAYIFNVTTGALVWTLNNPNAYGTSASDNFGNSVAISGNYAIVGTYREDDAGGSESGKAYIFDVTTGALVQTLNNPNAYGTSANDWFGQSVAISGNYAIVGAYREGDAGGTYSGKAYIFNVTTGALVWALNNPNAYSTSADDYFGQSVAISGNYAIVSTYQEDDAGGSQSGKAYIFDVTTGTLVQTLNNPNAYSTSAYDNFGWSVAISGDYAIVSANYEDDAGGLDSGKAYIFNVTTGALVWTLNNPNAYSTSASDYFGYSVAISGNYAIVGAYYEDDAGGSESGKAYIFAATNIVKLKNVEEIELTSYQTPKPFELSQYEIGVGLLQTLDNPNAYSTSTNDYFGYSVAISGNYAIVGAYTEGDAGGTYSGKAYIFDVTTGALVHTLNNPNAYGTSANDYFGSSVAISGDYVIVGAYYEDDAGGTNSGKAYIFNVTTGALVWTLNNPNVYSTSAYDWFGQSVAISGNRVIVGAYREDDAGGFDSGKAYIFNVTTGALVQTLNNPNAYSTSEYDYFGISVAISGNYAIVGAYQEDDIGGSGSGKAYIFNVTTGALVWTLNNPNAYSTSEYDFFGNSVAISGNYAIVGAQYEDDAGGTDSGKAYIFNVTTGALVWTLNNPTAYGTSANDTFGQSVDISGNYAIVSAYGEGDAGGASSGKAYIFNVTTGVLVHTLNNPNVYGTSANDYFGYSVAISGNYAIVGAYYEDDAGGFDSGKAYTFSLNPKYIQDDITLGYRKISASNELLQLQYSQSQLTRTLNNPNAYGTNSGDYFGQSVAISGNYAIVSAYYEDDAGGFDSGKAYIFNVTTGALVHTLNNPNAYSASADDYFGWSVAISGNYVIVGAYQEDDAAGFDSGKAYIFNVTTGALVHTLNNPNAYSTSTYDYFGQSVAISGDYAIVSAYTEDDATGFDSGKAYIFNVTTGALVWTLNNPNAYSTSEYDYFGNSVAISGNYAVVGANQEGDAGGTYSGKAYIFNVTTGALVWTLNNPNAYGTSSGDWFGQSVAISGNYAIVGAYYEGDAGGSGSGKAYIFNATTGALVHTLNNPNAYSTSASDLFGYSVTISGNYAIVGAYYEDDAGGSESGKAYIFDVTTGALVHTLNNPNAYSTSAGDYFGISVAISGNYAIVGAYGEGDAGGSGSGKAYIFATDDLTYLDRLVTYVS